MGRLAACLYGVLTYCVMVPTILYLLGFLANVLVPKGIDSGPTAAFPRALATNLGLLLLFAVPHSVMARPAFKEWWTRIVPKPVERTTYVLIATLLTLLLVWQWQPMTQVVWQVEALWARILLWGLFVLGILILFGSTVALDPFDLFGLRQVALHLVGRPYESPRFKVVLFYKFVRHPLYVGWLLLFWATPSMTLGHLVFALSLSVYILIAIGYEERDLERSHGRDYLEYKSRVPMLIPRIGTVHETVKPAPAKEQV